MCRKNMTAFNYDKDGNHIRICIKCNEHRPIEDYYRQKTRAENRRLTICKYCYRAKAVTVYYMKRQKIIDKMEAVEAL